MQQMSQRFWHIAVSCLCFFSSLALKGCTDGALIEGVSQQRLAGISDALAAYVQQRHYAGIISLVQRHGKVLDIRAHGYRDLKRRLPMQRDSIVPD